MVDIETWGNSPKTIKKSRRYYFHFDYRTDISKCWDYISVPTNISKHSFYPFIHYMKKMDKYTKENGIKEKQRDICYAAHIDRCIFQYYNFLLNNFYNDRCKRLGIDDVAVAYRTNLAGKSNIHFAKRAIDFIRNSGECYVMIGDFTKFFDNLDHEYLKKQWCSLLNESKLPPDHYAVFKNITRYSYIELTDLLKAQGIEDNTKGRRELNSKSRIFTPNELHEKTSLIKKNKMVGIPQGSPMSGVLANIYMLEVDKAIFDFVSSFDGLYMRYSDDFVVVFPNLDEIMAIEKLKAVSSMLNSSEYPCLELQPSKTQYYHFKNQTLTNCGAKISVDADCSNAHLNFLGFRFDGTKVSLRDKTVSKYYQRMRRKAKTISNSGGYTQYGNHISNRNLYEKYSERGAYGKKGNFLTYVKRAEGQFGENELIQLIPERNMRKIRAFLKRDYTKKTAANEE